MEASVTRAQLMAMGYRDYGHGWVRFVYDGKLKTPEDVQAAAVKGAIPMARAKAELDARRQEEAMEAKGYA